MKHPALLFVFRACTSFVHMVTVAALSAAGVALSFVVSMWHEVNPVAVLAGTIALVAVAREFHAWVQD